MLKVRKKNELRLIETSHNLVGTVYRNKWHKVKNALFCYLLKICFHEDTNFRFWGTYNIIFSVKLLTKL